MSYLYLTDSSAKLGMRDNYIEVKCGSDTIEKVPIETLEAISVYGKSQITTQCIQECLKRNIPIIYYSRSGKYYGRIQSAGNTGVQRQRKQAVFHKTSVALELAKKIIGAKIHNQTVVLRRYAAERKTDFSEQYSHMKILEKKIQTTHTMEEIMGYEGNAARIYFSALNELIEPDFRFNGRNRRPPKDPFNAMLSFGYSILKNEIYGKLEAKGLNPYFGFIHQDRENHPTLASDLMEEWRMVIVDTTVLSLINGHEILMDNFQADSDNGIYLTSDGIKIFLRKLESKFRQETKYLNYIDYSVSFRRAIELQINCFAHVLDEDDSGLYEPIVIR